MTHWKGMLAALIVAVATLTIAVVTYRHGWVYGWAAGAALYLALTAPGLLRHRPHPRSRWWSHTNLAAALTAAGAIPAPRRDDPPPVLHYAGKPQTSDTGTTVAVKLPVGIPAAAVQTRHAQLAAALNVPLSKLAVSHEPTDPAGVVRLWVGNPDRPVQQKHARSPLADTHATDWRDPVRIGIDPKGQPVTLATAQHNTLIAGMMGYGKTVTARLIVGHYMLDPSTLIYGLDGKGSRDDYGPVATLAQQWVWGTEEDAAEATLDMLSEVRRLIRDRHAAGTRLADCQGLLLILEEYQDIRASADKPTREQLDKTLERIVRTGRDAASHLLFSTQRPSVEDLPSGQRNLIDQRISMVVRDPADAKLVLGNTPHLPLPTRPGDAILALPNRDVQVTVDHLNDNDWRALAGRAAAARAACSTTTDTTTTQPLTTLDPDPLTQAVTSILSTTPNGLSATKLHALLPADLRPTSPAVLGKTLARTVGIESDRDRAEGRLWRLGPARSDGAHSAVGDSSAGRL